MSEEERPTLMDRAVDTLAEVMDSLGLNGTRLRWKWRQKRRQIGEQRMQGEQFVRSARAAHKMCPSCRALVPRNASECSECDTELGAVRAPGMTRTIENLLPGASNATSLILLVNGFWFVLTLMKVIQAGSGGAFDLFGGFDGRLLYEFGSGWSPATWSGEWWRLVTPIFLHGGLIHFFFNSYMILQLGPLLEAEFGTARFWIAYLLMGISGNIVSQALRPINTVGASTALFGMIGLLFVYAWRLGPRGGGLREASKRLVLYAAGFTVFMFFVQMPVDHLGHAGGFVGGVVLGLVLPNRNARHERLWTAGAVAGVILVLVCFGMVALRT